MLKKTAYGYTVEKDRVFLDIAFYSSNIIRFVYSREEKLPDSTPAIVAKPQGVLLELDGSVIRTEDLEILVDENTLRVSIYDREGNLLSRDRNVKVDNIEIEKEIIWEKGFYGMGEKYVWLNQKGTVTSNWNTDVLGVTPVHNSMLKEYHTAIPFYVGLDTDKAYGIYFDNSHRTRFDLGNQDENSVRFGADGGSLDYYFIYGKKISKVVNGYSHLTGTLALPRKDFLGYQQCRYSYETREELMEVARRMRKENIPCDVLYLDIHYMKDYKVFTIDSDRFPEFKEMIIELKKMGYKVVVIIDPGVKVENEYHVYEVGKKKGYFVKTQEGEDYVGAVWPGPAAFPDFLRSEVREWWGQLHKELTELGVEGIWNDMNEPADFTTESKTLPEDSVHKDDKGNNRSHSEIHNLYGLLEAEGTYNGLKNLNPNRRPFVLTRAAFSGTQRYAALWTGDNASIWEHLEMSMPMFMNLGLSGYAFVGADVGGFAGHSNGELLSRWTQLGSFTPFFRNHSMIESVNQEPWAFGEETLKNTEKYIKLRYSFITHLYNLMRESSQTGEPIVRPLFYHQQDDENTYNINDQFLFGYSIMVCPIIRPKTDRRIIYIPKGVWYDYWTGEKIEGGQHIIKKAEIDVLPIYVRAGAIIPKDEVMDYIGQKEGTLSIHCHAGANGEYKLYLDDGISFEYEKGIYSEILFTIEENSYNITVKGATLKNNYKIPKLRLFVHGVNSHKKIVLNDKEVIDNNENTIAIDLNESNFMVSIDK